MSQNLLLLPGVRPPTNDGRRSDDDYYTPRPLAKRLMDKLFEQNFIRPTQTLVDPHCGSGVWLDEFAKRGYPLIGADISADAEALKRYPDDTFQHNFEDPWPFAAHQSEDWIIGNPPYAEAEKHVRQALDIATQGVAFLLRLAFLSSQQRLSLFRLHPPTEVWVLVERPSFTGKGTDQYDYAFFIWSARHRGQPTQLRWLSWR